MPDVLPIPDSVQLITNDEFLRDYNPHVWRNPPTAVDVVLIDPLLRVRLIRRPNPPDHLKLALPGSFMSGGGEASMLTAQRAVDRYVGEITCSVLDQLHRMTWFEGPGRDIRQQVLSLAFLCPWPGAFHDQVVPGWVPIAEAAQMDLAFDHAEMLASTQEYLKRRVWDGEVMGKFFPLHFHVSEYRKLYIRITGKDPKKVNGSNFRKKALALGVIEAIGDVSQGKATLYHFRSEIPAP